MHATQIDILKTAIDWAKTEMFSSGFFAVIGLLFIVSSFCLWQFGKTDSAKAYVIPLLVTGGLLVILGVGLVISNQLRAASFPAAIDADASGFVVTEIERATKTITGYETAVFRVIPGIILVCAVIILFVKSPVWQASMVAVIAMMAVIMFIDSNANARLEIYRDALTKAELRD